MTTAQRKLNAIISELEDGHTLYFSTPLKSIKVTGRNYKKWVNEGLTMFKVVGDSLMIASGSKFVCVDGCAITIEYKE